MLETLLTECLSASSDAIPGYLYRARITEREPYDIFEMDKPPKSLSLNGRANPAGIPYLASSVDTAISEVRPHTGDKVCVAKYQLLLKSKIADLRDPKKTASPFSLDENMLSDLRTAMPFLCQLSEELAMPVLPKNAHLDYLPSQYLCEFIKYIGFRGVMYKSSVSDGTNVALFHDEIENLVPIELVGYEITKINITKTLFYTANPQSLIMSPPAVTNSSS